MRKVIIVSALIIGAGVAYWLISPLFITRQVDEDVSDIIAEEADLESATTAQGRFVGLASHSGEGTASLVQSGGTTYIRFGDDFRVTNGPDLFVYLGKDGEYAPEARLGALKGNAGAQNYEVPAELDVNEYNEVWVWCRAFFVPFAKAELR